jgi:two-component system sensor histidine kinase MprB
MSLRTKLVLALSLLSAFAAITIGAFSYRATEHQLQSETDNSLDQTVRELFARQNRGGLPFDDPFGPQPDYRFQREFGGLSGQIIGSNGQVVTIAGTPLPVDDNDKRLADAQRTGVYLRRNVTIDNEPYRMLTTSVGGGVAALQAARNVTEQQRLLNSLLLRIVIATAVVAVVGALLGWLIARQVTKRLVRLTGAAEEVASTGRLDVAVPVGGNDEAGRLGQAFNGMLGALATSRQDQQRLVQDAGHELRTPLTSLRTNIDVLRRHELDPTTRDQVLSDLESEARELSGLVDEVVELATERRADEVAETVTLGAIADRVAARARGRSGRQVIVTSDESAVVARPQSIERAISNLVDNAAKFDDVGVAPIEVTIERGRVTVADRGSGIDPADIPHLFDRFYRATSARSRPGSGLGLAIVKDVAESQGGSVFARAREGGGAAIGFTLPLAGDAPME